MKEEQYFFISIFVGCIIAFSISYWPFVEFNVTYFSKIIFAIFFIVTIFFLSDIKRKFFYKFCIYFSFFIFGFIISLPLLFFYKTSNLVYFYLFVSVPISIYLYHYVYLLPKSGYFTYKFPEIKLFKNFLIVAEPIVLEYLYLLIFLIFAAGIAIKLDFLITLSLLCGFTLILIPLIRRKYRELTLFSILNTHPYVFMKEITNKKIKEQLNKILEEKRKDLDSKSREELINLSLFHLNASLTAFIEGRFGEVITYLHSFWRDSLCENTEEIKLNKWSFSSIRNAIAHIKEKKGIKKEEIEPYLPELALQIIQMTVEKLKLSE
jgi:hypothetical protein